MAYSSKNPHLSTTLIKDQTTGSVGTAPSGSHRLVNRNGALYMVDSSGNESPVGAAGQGELNVVSNPSAAGAITGWAASNTGITVARTTTSTDLPLASVVSSAIKITPVSGTTDYVYYRWTMPAALKERKLKLEWHQRPLSGYAAGDLKVDVWTNTASDYSGTAARLALSTDSSAVTSIPNATGKFTTTFDGDASDYYEIRIYRTAGTTALNIANVIVGPGISPQGAVVGGEVSVTSAMSLTNGGTSPTITRARYWRRGETALFQVDFSTGTTTPASELRLNFPSGMTLGDSGGARLVGTGTTNVAGLVSIGVVATPSTSTSYVAFSDREGSSSGMNTINASTLGDSKTVSIVFEVKIAEWAGSGTVNVGAGAEVEYASVGGTWDANSTTTVYGPGGVLMGGTLAATRTKTITWQYPVQATDRIQIFASRNQRDWFPINGCRLGSSADPVVPSVSAAGANLSGVSWTQGANAYETIVYFSQYMQAANDDSPTINWPSAEAYWVATKSSGGQAVGFGASTTTARGLSLLPNAQVRADTGNGHGSTNTKIRRFTNATTTGTGITYADSAGNGGSFTINEAGVYSISYSDRITTAATSCQIGISLNSGSLTTNVLVLSASERLAAAETVPASYSNVSVTVRLAAGDVIRAHTDGTPNVTASGTQFTITQVTRL